MSLFPIQLGRKRVLLAEAGAALVAVVLVAGCGNNYRPSVTPVYGSGPASQVTSYAVVVSSPAAGSAGVATIIDYSGDAVMAEAPIGVGPLAFTIDELGATGYTYNSDGTITNFPVSTQLQQKLETVTTLPTSAQPVNINAPSTGLWIGDLNIGNTGASGVDIFTGSPQTFKLSVPVATVANSAVSTPTFVAGTPTTTGQRQYVISQNIPSTYSSDPGVVADAGVACNLDPTSASLTTGSATPIEVTNSEYTADAPIPVGKCPVFAVQSTDLRRLFVLNRGDDTITVINSQSNALDNDCPPPPAGVGCVNQNGQTYYSHPTLPLSSAAVTATGISPTNGSAANLPSIAGPVYAEYSQATSQLVVADYDGGTISVIDVSLDQYGNDSPTFGTTYTIPVGPNPASVTVLWDGSRAYTANQGDCGSGGCTAASNGTVTVVNLSTHVVEKTLSVTGLPRTVVSTENSLYGKVYVAAPNTNELSIIETETDLLDTTILIEGNLVDVRATTQSGASQSVTTYNGSMNISNITYSSRVPGWGQPCNLPPTVMNTLYPSGYSLAECQAIP